MIISILKLMRWHKPTGALLLLAPVLWSLLVAYQGSPPLNITIIVILGAWFSRSLGCVINDYFDMKIDSQVQRTKDRPLASGLLSPKIALIVFALLACICLTLLLLLPAAAIFSGIICALLLIIYPLTKRFFALPQLILAIAFSWSIVLVFATASPNNNNLFFIPSSISCWWLFVANLVWTIAYDTQYAMLDKKEDLTLKIKSSAIAFGKYQHFITSGLLMVFVFLLFALNNLQNWQNNVYTKAIIVVALLFYILLKKTRKQKMQNYRLAFHWHAFIGLIIALGIAFEYHYTQLITFIR